MEVGPLMVEGLAAQEVRWVHKDLELQLVGVGFDHKDCWVVLVVRMLLEVEVLLEDVLAEQDQQDRQVGEMDLVRIYWKVEDLKVEHCMGTGSDR